ncbi:integral membrane protein [Aspergillus terreus]|uniref:Integral membrane protein n=1 Tax=Aspergillus terreus TaxID=33178 RepID=A0A5M3YPK7_ASPTE|nr:hypothetical protein ATETN484_0002008300 [Aspergillus terreus]GFF13732.1 integral membrane protein [Aspergillus terreus]
MAASKTVHVPHLGGIKAGYALANDTYDASKPTCVLINSMCMTMSLYQAQFQDPQLTAAMNLLAIEPLGHGSTSCAAEHFTYWDTAIMALQVMDQLGIKQAFALGTSQGGWMVARMALLAPDRILGIMPLGASMDYESADSRSKGCWDPAPLLTPFYQKWTSAVPTPDWVVDETWRGMVGSFGFGAHATAESTAFWSDTLRDVYQGDEGRKKARTAVICLLERDGLLLRVGDIQCPVHWLHGTEDAVYSTQVAAEQIQLFVRSREAKLVPIEGGAHYLNATNPRQVNQALLEMVNKHRWDGANADFHIYHAGPWSNRSVPFDRLQPWVSATTIAVTVLAFVAVCLRLLARYERKQALWWDDWMILWSMAWNIVVVGFIFAMVRAGMGLHAATLPPEDVVLVAKFLVVAEILYVFNLVWTKISILLMYYRIFRFAHFKKWAYIISTFVVLWVICITFLFVFICVPVQKLWYPLLPGRCINQVATWIANAISTILTDLAILLLPIPQVWRLQLRLSEKLALTFAFGLGFFVVFASAYRLSVLFTYSPTDSSYTLAPTVGWTAIEMSAGIVSACLPTLRPALQLAARALGIQRFMPALLQSHQEKLVKSAASDAAPSTGPDSALAAGPRHSFYHLSDESDSDGRRALAQGHAHTSLDAALRPDYDRSHTVTDVRGRSVNGSAEEISLSGIRVQKEFTQFKQ